MPVRPPHPARADRDDRPVSRAGRDVRQLRHDPVAGVDDRPHETDRGSGPAPVRKPGIAPGGRCVPDRPRRCGAAGPGTERRHWGVTPKRRASALVVAGERSASSSRARAGPSSSSTTPGVASYPLPSHTVAVPRAGYSSVVCDFVASAQRHERSVEYARHEHYAVGSEHDLEARRALVGVGQRERVPGPAQVRMQVAEQRPGAVGGQQAGPAVSSAAISASDSAGRSKSSVALSGHG